MKKILAIILALALVTALVACGGKKNDVIEENPEAIVETDKTDEEVVENEEQGKEKTDEKADTEADKKPSTQNDQKPSYNPAKPETTKPENQTENKPSKPETQKPEVKPSELPAEKPAETPVEKPEEKPAASTLGNTLLADFKAKASSGMSVRQIAEGIMSNPVIKFSGGAMPVEEGLLSGFDNQEIKGFKEGYMMAPMIGSIAFVGYVFELENASEVSSFISNLKSSANMRWNICVEAEEMVTGSVDNKVFFVMCPTSLED